ncbi:SDR family oxidoreductase [Calidifontibacter indicus]|uniref:dTDP-4-dehydrorhamnose reductase n=1 Tax=Calidifontibacter indicus TaxID=419650 RepID=A0A3D9UVW8_9MICO|nr:sugar nucleotide-binding protein [Calidifontibacter indicus]REF30755.1 dTDP-4-dehydrorhamnose reductase [Calidifontibacter indicus]
MRVLVTGGSGALGSHLSAALLRRGDDVVATGHRVPVLVAGVQTVPLDLADAAAVTSLVREVRPDLVVNTAYAYADWTVTAVAPGVLAAAATDAGAQVVHISSDAVFSGHKPAYVETDLPDPLIPYGAAKAAAEVGVRLAAPDSTVVRTTLIMGHRAAPMETLSRALATGERDGVLFTDDVRCPVHVDDLVAALLELADARRPGMFHVGGPDALSRMAIGELVCVRDGLPADRLVPGLRADLPVPGALDLRLDCTATQALLRTRLRGAREFLATG